MGAGHFFFSSNMKKVLGKSGFIYEASRMTPTDFNKTTETIDGNEYVTYETTIRKTVTKIVIGPISKSVHIQNASNRAWKGFGKFFPNFSAMADAYKTPAMKAFVKAVAADQLPANVIPFAQ